MRQIYDDGSRYEKTALLARVQRMSRNPHHKQNPLQMQGVSQKTVGGKLKDCLNSQFGKNFMLEIFSASTP